MGRTKNNSSNPEKSNTEERQNIIIDLVKNCEENENGNSFEEQSPNTSITAARNLRRQALAISMQSSIKKYERGEEKQEEIKEIIKRSRGRPRKHIDIEMQRPFEKSYTENDILKFENEDINLLSIDISDSPRAEKPQSSVSPSFDSEAKSCAESIITISSEENSNSNPIVRAMQCTPTSDRNLSSPDVLQVQFNPSSTKTYKNKRKVVNVLSDNNITDNNTSNELNTTETLVHKDIHSDKNKVQISKTTPNFEVNPNFIRNTRKKVLKYDVCDLLNKKSHKKIQIEARIDSMPAKSKTNSTKVSDTVFISDLSKNETSPVKVIPKINDLPSIIRKNPQPEIDFPVQETPGNMFGIIAESTSPPKSLIQIQGKIVADNRLSYNKKHCNLESINEIKSLSTEQQNVVSTESPIKRRPGRPKTKKDNIKTNTSVTLETRSPKVSHNKQHDFIPSIIKEKVDTKIKNDIRITTVNKLLEFENKDFIDSDQDVLGSTLDLTDSFSNTNWDTVSETDKFMNKTILVNKIEDSGAKIIQTNEIGEEQMANNVSYYTNIEDLKKEEETLKNKSSSTSNKSKNSCENRNEIEKEGAEKNKILGEGPKIGFEHKEKLKSISSGVKNNESSFLKIKDIKEVRVLIKGIDNIKLRKQERSNNLVDKQQPHSSVKFISKDCEEVLMDSFTVNLGINESNEECPRQENTKESDGIQIKQNDVVAVIRNEEEVRNKNPKIEEYNALENSDNMRDESSSSVSNIDNNTNPISVQKKLNDVFEIATENYENVTGLINEQKKEAISSFASMPTPLNYESLESDKLYDDPEISLVRNNLVEKNIDATKICNDKNDIVGDSALKSDKYCSDVSASSSIDEKNYTDKTKDTLNLALEKLENKIVLQPTKPKELKTGMDIWLEKVQLESKLKNFNDSTKKYKTEKSQKSKSKEESKTKSDTKMKYDLNLHKNENKLKEIPASKEDQKYNSSKFRKDYKEKFESKNKIIVSKSDSKVKDDAKNKDTKDMFKHEKKLKEKDEIKIKNDSKIESKVKLDSLKQLLKIDKEELKPKGEIKNNKIEIFGQLGKNESSLRTIDIFNFAAKDEIAQKVYNKKKSKKSETSSQDKMQLTKCELVDFKTNDNDLNQKKANILEKSLKIVSKEKKIDKNISTKNDELDKSIEKELIKSKSEVFVEENNKIRKRIRTIDEEENVMQPKIFTNLVDVELQNNPIQFSEPIPINSDENRTNNDKVIEISEIKKYIKSNDSADISIDIETQNLEKSIEVEQNSLKSEISFNEQSTIVENPNLVLCDGNNDIIESCKLEIASTKESLAIEPVNENAKKKKVELPSDETNESSNEILDPLRDIESFLEAAGNLLSRSHSSDDEKDSIGRRGARNRSSDQSDDKIDEDEDKNEIIHEEDNLKIKNNESEKVESLNTLEGKKECQISFSLNIQEAMNESSPLIDSKDANINSITNLKYNDNNSNDDDIYRSISDPIILTPKKVFEKDKREEWFNQIDSSIDKDLNDEISVEEKDFNESLMIPKKMGSGPKTPPLPPPSLDDDLEKNRMKDNLQPNNIYNKDNLGNEIANSIISTSIKVPNSIATSIHELKFMSSPKNQNYILDEQLRLIESQINKKSKKKNETSQKDKELKKFLKTLKKNELSGDWKKTYKELKKIKKKSAESLAISKSSLKYSPDTENVPLNEDSSLKIRKSLEFQEDCSNSSTIRRSHRLKSMAMQQQSQQIAIGRGGLVRNDYEDLIRADLAQVQAQNTKFLKAMENSLNQFKQIKENEYKCERVISKEARRMICDCFLTKEEEDRGEYGCGDDCLNRLLMIECGLKCNVNDRCTNKRFQRGQYAPCRVFMTEKKGCGIFAEVEIPAGEFIMEYVGEVVDSDQFEKRAEDYSACKNKHFYFMSLRSNAIIDATSRGNISRFINHSCDPNAETQKWTVNGELRIGFFTTRAVAPGEEITFDYQFQRYGKQAQKCYCEAANCRGWIGEEPDSDEEIEEDVELNFKSKEDLEKISKDIQSYTEKDTSKIEDDDDDAQKLIRKEDEIAVSKSILTDEELKIKQQEREQRKKDKQRKREIRLAQQKHDFLEDPDLEDEIYRLSKTGLKNQVQTLRLSRLIVRAKLLQTRLNLLEILRAGEIPCRRLFLDYHGLKLLHGWMNESESRDSALTEDNLKMRLAILETLNCLPIPNRTMLKESKVYQILQNWAQDKLITISPIDDFASDSNSGHALSIKDKTVDPLLDSNTKEIHTEIKALAGNLINDWEVLPEVFRIPRKERVEQMKEHEREADRRYAALHVADDDSKTTRDRYKKSRWDNSIKTRWSNKSDSNKDRRRLEQEKLDDGLTKEQRRQAFAAKVAQDEAEKLNAEKRRNLEYEARREFEFKCKFFLLDCTKTHPRDIPFCVDQTTNTWYTLDKRKIPTPPSHAHIKIPPRLKSTNPADYKLQQLDLPQGWKFAIEPINGRIYYYHVKIRRPQWEPPPKIFPLVNPENNANKTISVNHNPVNANDNNSSDSSGSDSESFDEADATSTLVQERAISPRKEEDRVYNQNEMRRYKENKEKIRRRKEEIKRRKARILLKAGEQSLDENSVNQLTESDPLPIADYLISSDEDDTIVEELDSKLIEKIVKGESIVDELDALKIKKPLKRPLPIKEKANGNGSSNEKSSNVVAEFKKRPKMEDKKHKTNDEFKKSKSGNKNSRYFARKAKEKFRSDIAGIIVQHLQPYRKESCQIGKITTTEDFKHLARKLTHFVMIKELKHCDSTGQTLIVTDSVKNKSREFIKKYMAKYGEIYVRPDSDPEYKEIPI